MGVLHSATRRIEIDAGHRVTNHHSKCRSLHGHRYVIEATITGDLIGSGSQEGMVLDFSFMKKEMIGHIDALCDHATMLWHKDPLVREFLDDIQLEELAHFDTNIPCCRSFINSMIGKLYVMNTIPTAENLAAHWFFMLAPTFVERTRGQAWLSNLRVYETPNCWADFSGIK